MSLLPLLVIYIERERVKILLHLIPWIKIYLLWMSSHYEPHPQFSETAEKDNVLKHDDASGLLQRFMMQFPKIAQCKQTQIWKQSSAGCLGHTGHHRGQWGTESARKTKLNHKITSKLNAKFLFSASPVTLHMMDTSTSFSLI